MRYLFSTISILWLKILVIFVVEFYDVFKLWINYDFFYIYIYISPYTISEWYYNKINVNCKFYGWTVATFGLQPLPANNFIRIVGWKCCWNLNALLFLEIFHVCCFSNRAMVGAPLEAKESGLFSQFKIKIKVIIILNNMHKRMYESSRKPLHNFVLNENISVSGGMMNRSMRANIV